MRDNPVISAYEAYRRHTGESISAALLTLVDALGGLANGPLAREDLLRHAFAVGIREGLFGQGAPATSSLGPIVVDTVHVRMAETMPFDLDDAYRPTGFNGDIEEGD